MKTGFRSIVVGACLATVSSVFGAVDNSDRAPRPPAQLAKLEPGQVIVSQKTTLSANELAKYQQREQVAEESKTQKKAAGAGMDTSTIIIIGVLVAVVIVAAASGGGGGGGY